MPNDSHASRHLSQRRVAELVEPVGITTVKLTAVTSATQRPLIITCKAVALETITGHSVARQTFMDAAKLNGLIVEHSKSVEPNAFALMSAHDREIILEAIESELGRRHSF